MRITATLATVTAAGALTLGPLATAAPAFADTPATSSTTSSTPAPETGALMLSSRSVAPGQTVGFSGTCATQTGSGFPTVDSVTSSAFVGAGTITRNDPYAFSGTATVSSSAAPGTYTVTAHCSNGSWSAPLTVTGSHPAPNPTPNPTPNHGGGTHHGTTGGGSSAGTGTGGAGTSDTSGSSSTGLVAQVDPLVPDSSSALPWAIGIVAAAGIAGTGAYALGRGRAADRSREDAAQDHAGRDHRS